MFLRSEKSSLLGHAFVNRREVSTIIQRRRWKFLKKWMQICARLVFVGVFEVHAKIT